jgi:hypothetical protein
MLSPRAAKSLFLRLRFFKGYEGQRFSVFTRQNVDSSGGMRKLRG